MQGMTIRHIVTDVVWSACLSVGHGESTAKVDEQIEVSFGLGWVQGTVYYMSCGSPVGKAIVGICLDMHIAHCKQLMWSPGGSTLR